MSRRQVYHEIPVWPFFVLMLLYILVAVVMNMAVLVVVAVRRYLWTPANFYICSLSCADMVIALVVITSTAENLFNRHTNFTSFSCFIVPYFELLAITASILSLMAITVDRYQCVLPQRGKATPIKCAAQVITVWFISIVYALRIIPQHYGKLFFANNKHNTLNMSLKPSNRTLRLNYFNATKDEIENSCDFFLEENISDLIFRLLDFIFLFIIPFFVMLCMYGRIISTLWKKRIPVNAGVRKKRRVAKMLIASIGVFLACWIPFYMVEFVGDILALARYSVRDEIMLMFRLIFILLSFSNCFMNPIIYAYFNRNFCFELKSLLRNVSYGFSACDRFKHGTLHNR